MRFETLVVPRGAETRAVEQGWPVGRPASIVIAAGSSAERGLRVSPVSGTVLVLGLCGAIDAALDVGDVVTYGRIIDGAQAIELDPELAAACGQVCGRAPVVAAAVAHVIGDSAAKSALRAATGAAVIDMEAAAIARVLHGRGVRVAMVRVVSDDASRDLPDLNGTYDANGSLRPLALAVAFARAPRRSAYFIANAMRALRVLRATARQFALSATD